jgi:hypothetical protein
MDMELVEWPAELFDCLQKPRHGGANLLSFVLHNGQLYRYDQRYTFFERPYTEINNIKSIVKEQKDPEETSNESVQSSHGDQKCCDILNGSLEVRGVVSYIPPRRQNPDMLFYRLFTFNKESLY